MLHSVAFLLYCAVMLISCFFFSPLPGSLGVISAVGIYWNKTSLAAYYSVQACEFASSTDCLEIYAGLYAEGLGKYLDIGPTFFLDR